MKKIYFIRHAESEDEAALVYQRDDTSLSEFGRDQAALLAGKFSHTPFDHILSSPLERAKETAEFVALASGKEITYLDSLQEIKVPSLLHGVELESTEFDAMQETLHAKWHLPAWHHSDEENFNDVKKRAVEVLHMLKKRPEEKILVISHGHFLTMLFLVMALGKLVTADEFRLFDEFFFMDTTALSVCELGEKGWKMRTFNDRTHIREMIH